MRLAPTPACWLLSSFIALDHQSHWVLLVAALVNPVMLHLQLATEDVENVSLEHSLPANTIHLLVPRDLKTSILGGMASDILN